MSPRRGGYFVAVVDDEAALREATENLLKSAGIPARSFDSAEAFLRCANLARAACIILDVRLPGIDGLQLQQRLLADGLDIPTIFLTAYEDMYGRMRRQALRSGALAFLHKPCRESDLLGAVETAFEA